mmetsp:Transcript_30763/g.64407  ORF Transcript_30763/g.64407 Transcript_30763/m.64407 type:complete len:138 (-) Transcript_30763:536-949(-)
MVFRTSLACIVLLLALGSSLAYVPLPLLQSNKAAKRTSCQTRMSTSTLHRPKSHPFDAAERARRKMQHKVDIILFSENKLMKAEEEALTTLTTLDVFSSIIILSLLYSMLPNWDRVSQFLDQNPAWSYIWLNILVRP